MTVIAWPPSGNDASGNPPPIAFETEGQARRYMQKRLDEIDLDKMDGMAYTPDMNDLAPYADKVSPAAQILAEGIGLLEGERAIQHGDKLALHKTMAGLFTAYLGIEVKPSEAAMLEALIKIARTKHGLLNPDDYRDGGAYVGISWECADAGC